MISSAQSSFQKARRAGKRRPRVSFVAKGSEDLRQDDRIERLFRAMDALLLAHPGSRHRGLTVRTFHVAPLSARCGLLEFVGGTTPMLEAVRGSTKDGNNCVKEHQFWIRAQASAKDKDIRTRAGTKSAKRGRHRSNDWHVQASCRPRGRQVRVHALPTATRISSRRWRGARGTTRRSYCRTWGG